MKSTTMHRIVALAATVVVAAACGGDASLAEKSGGEATPLTLRLGTVENDWAPYAPYVNEFVRLVEETSGGSIDVEVAWEAVPWTPESEGTLATMVGDGDIDLALVPTRGGWDGLGVTSLRALQTPFLVDSLELLNTIVTSDLADEMFADLDTLGIEGLALWPDALRHPIGFERPLLTAADFEGAQLTYPSSDTALRLFQALGVEALAGSTTAASGVDGVEAAFNIAENLAALGTFTANITFYPKVNALVGNADVFESLSDDQRDVLRQAATDISAYAVATNRSEADLAEQYCAAGGSVALADAADLAELTELAEPVFAWLEAEDTTRRIIDEIRELKAAITADPTTAAAACGPAVEEVSQPAGPPSQVSELPDGVYRVDVSLDDVEAAGQSITDASSGLWTIEVDDGTYVIDCAPHDRTGTDCGSNLEAGIVEAGQLRGTGNTAWFVYDVEMISELQGCQLPVSNEPGHCFPMLLDYHLDWALDGDRLTFSNWGSATGSGVMSGGGFTIEPWTRIEGADQPDTETASFPEGTYRMEVTAEEMIDAGVSSAWANDVAGVWTWTFDDGQLSSSDVNAITGNVNEDPPQAYCFTGNRIYVYFTPPCGDTEFWSAEWTFEDGALRFTDFRAGPESDVEPGGLAALWATNPWEKTS